ncbi:MAG: hypothetical protein KGS73_06690 [Chloroflexi bacterium]|nr:hypothetical protein [Chloroflexota bacterium]
MLHSFLWFLCQPHCGLSIAVCHFLFAVVQLLPETKEKLLVDSVSPRPRDVLWLMQQTLRQYWLRTSGAGGYIERIDLDKALKAVELEFCKNQSSQNGLD